ncbi:MAG: transcription elongation factor GreA, partial [Ileibacterium sp.]|nr:transcription elongation factor GreA [Ileibacterium sp.]
MAENKTYVTQEGLEELQAELDNLIHVVRQQVIVELQEARAQGDLSENADYDAARDHQARVEARIRELEALIKNSVIIQEDEGSEGNAAVRLGTKVTIKDLSDGTEATYSIVGTIEADPFEGKISNDSPFA